LGKKGGLYFEGGAIMRKNLILTLIAAVSMTGCATATRDGGRPFQIAEDGRASCRIVIAEDAPASTQYAAQELRRFLGEMTGAEFEVVSDTTAVRKGEIILGENRHFEARHCG